VPDVQENTHPTRRVRGGDEGSHRTASPADRRRTDSRRIVPPMPRGARLARLCRVRQGAEPDRFP